MVSNFYYSIMTEREEEIERIKNSFEVYEIPLYLQDLVIAAIEDIKWDFMDSDGCTAVPNWWPSKYSPPCLFHDYARRVLPHERQKWADQMFRRLMLAYSFTKFKANLRFIGVRIIYITIGQWTLAKTKRTC